MDRSKWEYKKLTDVCSILYGYPFDSKCFNETNQGRPLIRIRDVVRGYTETYTTEDCPDDYIINEGDYLVGMDGEFNISSWKSAPALLNQRVCKIAADGANLIDGFMYYLMKTKLKEIEGETAFVTVKHLSAKVLNKVNVHLPSISDQQRIVAELDCLNEMIAVKQEQLKEFDKLAQSIFYDMFGDPLHESKWDKVVLGEVCKTTSGGTPSKNKSSYYEGGNIGWLRSGDITTHIWENKAYITKEGMDNSSAKLFPVNTVVVAMYGATVGQVGILHIETTTNQAVCGIFPNKNIAPTYLCYHFMCIKPLLIKNAIGGAQPNISQGLIKSLNVPLPPLSLQQQFADKISAIEAQKELVKQSIAETQALLDYSMDYYFNE